MKKIKGSFDATQTFLYQRCIKEWWPALDSSREILQFKKGEPIFKEGDAVNGVYFMVSGLVKVHKQWTEDKELIIRFAHQQDIIGHRGLSTHSPTYHIGATALSDTIVCFISLQMFEASFAVNKDFAYDFMMFMADELMLSEERMRNIIHMQVRTRAAKALLFIEKKFGIDEDGYIACLLSRQDIASYTGMAYETLYKLLLEFNEAGLIQLQGKNIAILQHSDLEKIVASPS